MNRKGAYYTFLVFLFFLPVAVFAQLSKGGTPIQIQKQKSAMVTSDLVIMPEVKSLNFSKIQSYTGGENMLKPFQFAYGFPVSLNLNNSGTWYNTSQVNVWQLYIRSTGAYSLNLIFDQYHLPENARLFIVNEATGEIKGAFTSDNNAESKIFAIEPIAGDEILVQYEEPVNADFRGELNIAKVAHDFVGIVAKDHRPLGVSGTCNVNINCDSANGYENQRDGVCRIIIDGTELCSGALINNTAQDRAPYILTAYHCIKTELKAQASVFLFNYESPYCGSIDSDVTHSLSGSSLKANLDSLDFSLVRLNTTPPDNFHPYWVGWNRKNSAPSSSASIHHPMGDIKKISFDKDAAISAKYTSAYLNNGFWKVEQWDSGVTEVGSSGGPLFDQNKRLIGTLTGGSASCPPGSPIKDFFEKFALAWDHRKETGKQLKAWLDPTGSNAEVLDGISVPATQSVCKVITNFKDTDLHATVKIPNGGTTTKGYWSGTNSTGITEFAEQYTAYSNCEISGISLGIAKASIASPNTSSYIDVQVYQGTNTPDKLIYTEKFNINKFYTDAMNLLTFATPVKTSGNFFISYNVSKMNAGDTLVVYMANRKSDVTNSFFMKNKTGWITYNSVNDVGNGSALLTELIACNVNDTVSSVTDPISSEARFYPNPLNGNTTLNVETIDQINCPEDIAVYDLLGKKQNIACTQKAQNKVLLDFTGKRAGIYLIHLDAGGKKIVGKISYIPN